MSDDLTAPASGVTVPDAAPKPKKRINLRTPEIMKLVQEQVESHYRSRSSSTCAIPSATSPPTASR
jgi:hypothetical protein